MTDRSPVRPDDLRRAATLCRHTLTPALDHDWTIRAHDLEWSCRRTLDHLPDALLFYAVHLATRSAERLPPARNSDPSSSISDLLSIVEEVAAILAAVAEAAPPTARGFHAAGLADPEGFLAMGCAETLIHTNDIAVACALLFDPPADLCSGVVRRLFPWAPAEITPWDALRWAAGRIALPDRPRLDADWWWQCAPLAEWDGEIKRRTTPPAWR